MFDYISNVNKRSKRIKLQFCAYRGLIITSPKKLSAKRLDKICIENQNWIKAQQLRFPLKQSTTLPDELNLITLSQSYQLTFLISVKTSVLLNDNHLTIMARDKEQQLKSLKKWVRQQAKKLFAEKLQAWSVTTALSYSKLSVRSQKSRWGSCSSAGTISLNDQLLFMPSSVLDYIIVHELCHTVLPNHSARYWALVEQHYPNHKLQEQLLAQYAKQIPSWFRASLYSS